MNTFYQKLNEFGTLVRTSSSSKKMDMANYFILMHPGHPVVKNVDKTRPGIRFTEGCPWSVKREVATLLKKVFGV